MLIRLGCKSPLTSILHSCSEDFDMLALNIKDLPLKLRKLGERFGIIPEMLPDTAAFPGTDLDRASLSGLVRM